VLTVFVGAVSAMRLDHWARRDGLKRVDLIKLDVEGAETHVLAGAAQTLERFRPILLTEYNPRCAAYFGEPPDAYFRLLGRLYTSVRLIEPDGSLSELPDWETLEARLEQGKGWEDLLCEPSRATRG